MSEPLLAGPLAKALQSEWEAQQMSVTWEDGHPVHFMPWDAKELSAPILAALRSDPAVLAAMAEALHDIGPEPLLGLPDVCNLWPEHERQAAAILDALLGPTIERGTGG